jgi:hypothetical protein
MISNTIKLVRKPILTMFVSYRSVQQKARDKNKVQTAKKLNNDMTTDIIKESDTER